MEEIPQSTPIFAILEAAAYALAQPQLNSEVGAEARRSQQVCLFFSTCHMDVYHILLYLNTRTCCCKH